MAEVAGDPRGAAGAQAEIGPGPNSPGHWGPGRDYCHRKGAAASVIVEWGISMMTMVGQRVSGDGYTVKSHAGGVLAAVVDGLGHGECAAAAAQNAVSTLEAHAEESVTSLFRRCHSDLRGMRPTVMALAQFSTVEETLTWLSVGNVRGVLLPLAGRQDPGWREVVPRRGRPLALSAPYGHLPTVAGTVGAAHLPRLVPLTIPVHPGDTLVQFTDGVRDDFLGALAWAGPPQELADRILSRYAKGTDDALVLVTRYVGGVQ